MFAFKLALCIYESVDSHTHTHTHIYIYIYGSLYVCVYIYIVCVCVYNIHVCVCVSRFIYNYTNAVFLTTVLSFVAKMLSHFTLVLICDIYESEYICIHVCLFVCVCECVCVYNIYIYKYITIQMLYYWTVL